MSAVDALGPDASVEDIESDLAFYEVLLSTLDVDADDFLSQKDEYQEIIQQLKASLAAKQPSRQASEPQTPPRNASHSSVNGSASLPSRSRPAVPDWSAGSFLSPTGRRFNMNSNASHGSESSSAPTFDRDTTQVPIKRARNVSSGACDPSPKHQRTSESLSGSGSSRPVSQDSGDDIQEFYGGKTYYNELQDAFKQKWIKQEKEREERRRQELADAEFARQLQSEVAIQGNNSSIPTMQSWLNLEGIQLPGSSSSTFPSTYPVDPPAIKQIKPEPQIEFTVLEHPSNSTNGISKRESPSNQGPFGYTQPPSLKDQYNLGKCFPQDDGSDDFQVISPDQFRESVQGCASRLSPNDDPGQSLLFSRDPNGRPFNSMPVYESSAPIPGAYPPTQVDPHNFGFPSPFPAGPNSQPWTNQVTSAMPFMMNHLNNLGSSSRAFDSGMHGVAGASVFAESDSDGELSVPINYDPYGAALEARGLESLRYDATKTAEDIKALVENIRPDEDLPPEMREGSPPALKVLLMAHQKLGLGWLKKQEEGSNRGGILADDMGLGKTIQALALILERKSTDPAVKTTLIIAPVALMRQWEREIHTRVKPDQALSVYIYHGPKKNISYSKLRRYDVVLTTFGTVAAEHKRKRDTEYRKRANPGMSAPCVDLSLLGDDCQWYRIIIDEAQNIKNKSAKTSIAASALRAQYRLCLTGTPMMNSVSELYSLIRFLRIAPYNDETRFNADFTKPLKGQGQKGKDKAMRQLQVLLKAILLRRTKDSKIDGEPILKLPPRTTEITHAIFDEEQQDFYNALEQRTQLRFNRYLENNTIGKNYSNILVLLLRLRQACCHPQLIKDHGIPIDGEAPQEEMEDLARKLSAEVVSRIKATDGAFECPICYDASDNPTIFFPCGHDVCAECFGKITDPGQAAATGEDRVDPRCPECRQSLDARKIIRYNVFKKVHLGDLSDNTLDQDQVESDAESDIDDSDSDGDSQGDLDGFIVPDDDVDDEVDGEEDSGKENQQVDIKTEHCQESQSGAAKPYVKTEKARVKSKGKGKAKKETRSMAQLKKEGMRNVAAKRKYMRRLRKSWETSAKIEKTTEILRHVQDNDPSEKTIIFSQFTSFLDLLEIPLLDMSFRYERYDGSMNPKQRNDAVEKFTDDANTKIMLVGLKAGNSGLNLNIATQVIILDPFWNPFIEEQAIDRAHRIGQMRPVKVHRILIDKTVEDRIIALQEKKRELINQALDESASRSVSRLGRQELAYLFGVGPPS